MKRFVAGADRAQSTLLPESLDDWVDESNSVRVIDAFVDALNVGELGFEGSSRRVPWHFLAVMVTGLAHPSTEYIDVPQDLGTAQRGRRTVATMRLSCERPLLCPGTPQQCCGGSRGHVFQARFGSCWFVLGRC